MKNDTRMTCGLVGIFGLVAWTSLLYRSARSSLDDGMNVTCPNGLDHVDTCLPCTVLGTTKHLWMLKGIWRLHFDISIEIVM